MQINTQRENKTVECNILLRYGLEMCITQLSYSFRFCSFFKISLQGNFVLTPLWWYVLLSAMFLFSSSFVYVYPQSKKDYIYLQIFPFPSGNIYAPCVMQSSSSSLLLNLQRTGQKGEGSRFSAVYHQSYHSGWQFKFLTQYLFLDAWQKPYRRLICLRRLNLGQKIRSIAGDPLCGCIASGDRAGQAKRWHSFMSVLFLAAEGKGQDEKTRFSFIALCSYLKSPLQSSWSFINALLPLLTFLHFLIHFSLPSWSYFCTHINFYSLFPSSPHSACSQSALLDSMLPTTRCGLFSWRVVLLHRTMVCENHPVCSRTRGEHRNWTVEQGRAESQCYSVLRFLWVLGGRIILPIGLSK